MTSRRHSSTFALFRVAAGPRIGHGHLRRAEALARALGRPAAVSLRGAGTVSTWLPSIREASPAEAIASAHPAVLVIDDPSAAAALPWCRVAARVGVPVVSVHDLGLARVPSTLAVDGSVWSPARHWPAAAVRRGLEYAILRPPTRNARGRRVTRVLISLGGGPRLGLVAAVARELAARWPGLDILTPQVLPERGRPAGLRIVSAPDGLGPWLANVDVAVLAGGVTLYEALAAGVPVVATAVVAAQQRTIRGFAQQGLVVDAGRAFGVAPRATARRVADALARIHDDAEWRTLVRRDGPRRVDGRGAGRVARAILTIAGGGTRG